eukprot:TRINITY_DN43059_c0_g1_i1.p2 TRINITY_DN43059_c0_g1~~TRINITY_DN43059_c0_g1_i1.p2  ORF type:complete len:115 (+),score=40.17 TRINITY_DN43059_c0_g1_i1:66-410(+)
MSVFHGVHIPAVPLVPVESLAHPTMLPPHYVSYSNEPYRCVTHTPAASAIASGFYPPQIGGLSAGPNICNDEWHGANNKLFLPVDVHRNAVRHETVTNSLHRGPTRNRAGIPYM